MIFDLTWKSLRAGKARFRCAVAGVAVAAGAVAFVFSLAATNTAQAPALAKRASAPWAAWKFDAPQGGWGGGRGGRSGMGQRPAPDAAQSDRPQRGRRGEFPPPMEPTPSDASLPSPDAKLELVALTIDYRPGGRVLQGPPMRAILAAAPKESPYTVAPLTEGRWVDNTTETREIVVTKDTLRRFGRGEAPPLGSEIKFVGQQGTMTAKLVGYLASAKLPPNFPGTFANRAAFAALNKEIHGTLSLWRTKPDVVQDGVLTAESEQVVRAFTGDEQRRMDYARPLMLIAAVLTALSLLVNSLLLSVEANRATWATLRTVGLTRLGVVGFVAAESLLATLTGLVVGFGISAIALLFYATDSVVFPMGVTFHGKAILITSILALLVAFVAVLFVLRPALSVRPLDAAATRPGKRRRGMAVAFACGFGAFVAVEVWGASLMRAFVPSPEWPDAIVSILPSGVSPLDMDDLRSLPGVKRISELYPLQINFHPAEPMNAPGGRGRQGPPQFRNALLLASEWLPPFRFTEGNHEEASAAISNGTACVICEMISRARNLHKGDKLPLSLRNGTTTELPIVGVVDVNWHMVTSRGLVRGLNRMPPMTDGPVFVSFPTVQSLDPRPPMMASMTHLFVEYEPEFLRTNGVFRAGRLVEAEIDKALGTPSGSTVRLHARDEIADGTLAHGSDVIGEAARVPYIFLTILAIGFVAMLVAEADATRREFAILRAVGATRWQLTARLCYSALKTALIGIVCGIPIGAAAGWYFSLKTGSIWPGIPHYFEIPWQIILEGAAGAVISALVFALPTSIHLIRRTNETYGSNPS
ncbi:MAG: ABC transporter permease [Kiritimatiellae bacterium]|nr:ABC transporter permease [Kiritimatiellia bacterium]